MKIDMVSMCGIAYDSQKKNLLKFDYFVAHGVFDHILV